MEEEVKVKLYLYRYFGDELCYKITPSVLYKFRQKIYKIFEDIFP